MYVGSGSKEAIRESSTELMLKLRSKGSETEMFQEEERNMYKGLW